jgi:hypothetical protein
MKWCGRLQISCHKHRFKHLNFNYIYRICCKIAKRASSVEWIYPYLKTISQLLNPLLKLRIHSRYQKFSSGCDMVWLSHKFNDLIFGSYCRYRRFSWSLYVGDIQYNETGQIRVLSITYHHYHLFRFLTISQSFISDRKQEYRILKLIVPAYSM